MKTIGGVLLLVSLVFVQDDVGSKNVVGLTGSAHDFSGEAWTGGDKCVACHAGPTEKLPADAPIRRPSAPFGRTFGDAVSPGGKPPRTIPGPGSLVCIGCHDGTVTGDMFGGLAAPRSLNLQHPALRRSGHGGTNHPVGVEYPAFDLDYRPVNAVLSEQKVLLPNGRVECTSCHDPHNQTGSEHMLTKDNTASALCLTCHRK